MAKFLPLRDVYSASEDEDEDETTLLTDDVDGPGEAFQKYYTKFMERFRSRKRAKAKRQKAEQKKEKEEEKASKPPVDEHEYDFHNAKRGMAVIINNDKFHVDSKMGDRKGSKHDANGLVTMFKQLGFDVTLHNNLTTKEMVSTLQQAASNKTYDHEDADCFACAILSHGGEEVFRPRDGTSESMVRHDVVFGVDGTLVPTRFLLSIFNDECCPELEGKPRLFFIQACRGVKMDKGTGIKVLTRKKKTTASGGDDEQDAQMYVSESEEEEEEEDEQSVPKSGVQSENLESSETKKQEKITTELQKEQGVNIESSVPETKKPENMYPELHEEQGAYDDRKGKPEDKVIDAVKATKDHPFQESSVQETQGPTETKKEGKRGTEEKTHAVSEEHEVVHSRIDMEKILTISPSSIYKDFMLMYAAPPGYFAWRRDTGGWLIQTLVNVLRTADVTSVPLTKLLTTVSRRVTNEYESFSRKSYMNRKKLMPCVMSMLTKDVYFRSKNS